MLNGMASAIPSMPLRRLSGAIAPPGTRASSPFFMMIAIAISLASAKTGLYCDVTKYAVKTQGK
jgi:hypothetical protein